jgi:integrase
MSRQLTETLRALLVERKKETLKNGWGEVPPWVFTNETGGMLDGDNLRHRVHRGILKKIGLRQVCLHDLRHSYASLLIQNGESLAYVKEQLGHHSIQITVDTSGHLVPGEIEPLLIVSMTRKKSRKTQPSATNGADSVLDSRVSA